MDALVEMTSRLHVGRRGRNSLSSGVGVVVAVALLLVVPPFGSAAAVSGSLRAPYSGTVTTVYDQFSRGGCAAAKMLKNATFDPLTGRGYFGARVAAKPCAVQFGGIGSTSDGSATGVYTIAIPFAVGGTGYYHIKLAWVTHFNVSMSYNPGSCTGSGKYYGCSTYAYWNAFVSVGLFDNTNGSGIPFTGPGCWNGGCGSYQWDAYRVISNNTDCGASSGGCTLSSSTSVFGVLPTSLAYYLNTSWPILSSQNYSITVEAGVQEYSAAGVYGNATLTGATSSITFNGATLGNYQRLLYVSWK